MRAPLGNTLGAPEVPPGSGWRSPHHAQAAAVLDHSRALPQGDGGARPALAGGAVGSECNLVILDAGNMLHDAFAVRGPSIDAEGEVRSRRGHLHLPRDQSSSDSRFTAGVCDCASMAGSRLKIEAPRLAAEVRNPARKCPENDRGSRPTLLAWALTTLATLRFDLACAGARCERG
jgi:hypothetical protein